MKKIALILGTDRPNRIGMTIAHWVQKQMVSDQFDLSIIDLKAINLPMLDEPEIPARGHYQQPHTQQWAETIAQFDGFVFLFPQYNWGCPAVLKNAVDYLYAEWAKKPVSIVAYGNHGGFQSQNAFRFVTTGLHMHNLAVNPELNISDSMFTDHHFIDIDQALAPSQSDFVLLTQAFENALNA